MLLKILTIVQTLCIYIVEDNALMATTLKHILKNMGHEICGMAKSYDDAVKDLQQITVDLVITDIMIEGEENGIDLARYINTHLQIPFIIQSSVTAPDILSQAYSTCPKAFLLKPVSRSAIVKALEMVPKLAS